MTPIYLDTAEASHAATLKKGDRMVVVRMLKEQPPDGYEFNEIGRFGLIWFHEILSDRNIARAQWEITLRYPPGVELAVKESWWTRDGYLNPPEGMEEYKYCGPFWYKADKGNNPKNEYKWLPSITMPKEAVRLWIKPVENRVDKCCNITMNEATLMGIDGDPMRRYCPEYPAYYLEPYITKKYGKNAWEHYAEIVILEGL